LLLFSKKEGLSSFLERVVQMVRVVFLSLLLSTSAFAEEPVTVFAASSLTNALQDVGALWAAQGHPKPVLSFAASSTLAQQIENGAPAGVFISADEKWMDELAHRGALAKGTRHDLLGNSLVLVEARARLHPVELKRGVSLVGVLGSDGLLAVGDPAHVPAGIYAKQALQTLGAWDGVKNRLVPADSVRSALRFVELGEVPAGIVYATDVKVAPSLAVAGVFPAESHEPIRYPAAVLTAGDGRAARGFLAFLSGQAAQDVFVHYGFTKP